MRVFFDILGAPGASGGMKQYAEGVLQGWIDAFPEDELILFGGQWVADEFGGTSRVKIITWKNDSTPRRILGQLFVSAILFAHERCDSLISLSPVVSPLVPRRKRVASVQDWRHINNPHEFGRAQLLYRRLWKLSVAGAGAVVSMSTKTHDETMAIVPTARGLVVETGRDYARYWPPAQQAEPDAVRTITTFGHHTNKRPELVIDALALLDPEQLALVSLVVLGARNEYREALRSRARNLGVLDSTVMPGFIDEIEYQSLVQRSSLIVLASSDEGFGLPVAEANYFGIPALVTSDSGLASIHHQGIVVAEPSAESIAAAIQSALNGEVQKASRENLTTWADTATGIRQAALDALGGRHTPPQAG
jgi:glycosyltransferase involved in cell wall biosynthesis